MTTEKDKMTERIEIRVTEKEKNQIKMLAMAYARGNVSAYVVSRVLNSNRAFVNDDSFEYSKRRVVAKLPSDKPTIGLEEE